MTEIFFPTFFQKRLNEHLETDHRSSAQTTTPTTTTVASSVFKSTQSLLKRSDPESTLVQGLVSFVLLVLKKYSFYKKLCFKICATCNKQKHRPLKVSYFSLLTFTPCPFSTFSVSRNVDCFKNFEHRMCTEGLIVVLLVTIYVV